MDFRSIMSLRDCLYAASLGAALLLFGCSGGGSKETIEVNEQGFIRAQAGLEATVRLMGLGQVPPAGAALDRLRGFFHDVTRQLEAKDPETAQQLSATVASLREELKKGAPELERVLQDSQRAVDLLGKADTALGFPPLTQITIVTPAPSPSPTPR